MPILSLVWGVLAFIGMVVAFFPCLGALNWLVIPFAAIGVVISIVAVSTSKPPGSGPAVAGLVCNVIAVVIGTMRLWLGMGFL